MAKFLLSSILTFFSILTFGQYQEFNVWQGVIPGSIENSTYKETVVYANGNSPRFSRVTQPTMRAYIVAKEKANGTAVIICPGGGYARLAIDHEGYQVAEWLNTLGISAFVLKYRLPHDSVMRDKQTGPLADAQEAMRFVRRHAKEWGINPSQIGVMGFSAGGHLASTLSTHYADKVYECTDSVSARPDFSVLVYPVITMGEFTHKGSCQNLLGKNPDSISIVKFSNEKQVNEKTPRAFLVHSFDDKTVPVQNSINYFLSLKKYNIPSELHIYEKGGHGYGLAVGKGSESAWPEALKNWLRQQNFL
jgi:acetyl esterase/lipase